MASTSLVTPEGRTSFMKVFTAEMGLNTQAGKEFSVRLIIPKMQNMAWIQEAWDKVVAEEFGTVPARLRPLFSAGDPFDDKGAILDGDWKYANVAADKQDMYEAYRGSWIIGFKAKEAYPPAVVDELKNEILNQAQFQSGDYARCVIELSSYMGKKPAVPQVSIKLVAIQKMRDGERFSGGISTDSALSMFGDAPGTMDDLL